MLNYINVSATWLCGCVRSLIHLTFFMVWEMRLRLSSFHRPSSNYREYAVHRPVLLVTGPLWKIKMTLSSLPDEGLGAVKSTLWKDILKIRCWSTDVSDGKPLVTVPVTRALRELLRKGVTSQKAKQSWKACRFDTEACALCIFIPDMRL